MTNIKPIIEAIHEAGKAARMAGAAINHAKSTFQQIVGAIRATKLERLFVEKNGNDFAPRDSRTLTESEQKLMEEIRKACIAAYGWEKSKISASFRHWKWRIANELSGRRIAEKSREARKRAKEKELEARKKALAALLQELQAALNAKTLKTCKEHVKSAIKIMGADE